jgi:hypothetical protein
VCQLLIVAATSPRVTFEYVPFRTVTLKPPLLWMTFSSLRKPQIVTVDGRLRPEAG